MTAAQVTDFLDLSYAAHQATITGRAFMDRDVIRRLLDELLTTGLVIVDEEERLALSDLGRLAGAGMVAAHSVLTLAGVFGQLPARAPMKVKATACAMVWGSLLWTAR